MLKQLTTPEKEEKLTHMDWLLSPKRKCWNDRTWEDLNEELLVNVLAKVGTESMLLVIPYVCKSWHRTSRNPACWKRLIFPDTEIGAIDPWSCEVGADDPWNYHNETENARFEYFIRRCARKFELDWGQFRVSNFINNVINHSKNEVQFLKLPGICTGYAYVIKEILQHINQKCRKFCGLHLSNASINEDEISAIVTFVPNVKYLCLRKSRIYKYDLVKILNGCKDLEVLDVRDCIGFDEGDAEILELASHIPKFICSGSKVEAPLIEIHDEEDEEVIDDELMDDWVEYRLNRF